MEKDKISIKKDEDEIDLKELIGKLLKHKNIIFISIGVFLFISLIYILFSTPVYKSQSIVLIEPENTSNLVMKDVDTQISNYIVRKEYMETQKEILNSKYLAKEIAKKLKLYENEIFNPEKKEKNEILLNNIANALMEAMSVSFMRDTRLVKITAQSIDPQLCAKIVTNLTEEYKKFIIERKYETTKDTIKYLENQINTVKQKLLKKERQLQMFGAQKELFYVKKEESTVLKQFSDINNAYAQAQIERIKQESEYNQLKNMKYTDYPVVVNNPIIRDLKQECSKQESEYNNKKQVFKTDYPEMKKLKAGLKSLENRIQKEIKNVAIKKLKEIKNNYESALQKEKDLKQQIKNYQDKVVNLDEDAITYNTLQIEVTNYRSLLNYLTQKHNETVVYARLSGLTTSNVKVIDTAEIPEHPFKPRKKLIVLISIFLGGIFGIFVVFVFDFFKDSISSNDEIQNIIGKPILAVIPNTMDRNKSKYKYGYGGSISNGENPGAIKPELILHFEPDHIVSEHYRTLRTSLLFSKGDASPSVISITSTLSEEGKTTTITNLAISFAKLGEKVILVDGDMRKPKLHKIFEVKNHDGLSEILIGKISKDKAIKKTDFENISFINSGTITPNPSELLNSRLFSKLIQELKKDFDKVFIDSPPVIPVVDPLIIGNVVDGIIVTVWKEKISKSDLDQCVAKLRNSSVPVLGVVVNKGESNYFGKYSKYKKYRYIQQKT